LIIRGFFLLFVILDLKELCKIFPIFLQYYLIDENNF